jgi:hypothetical protein
VSHHRTHLIWRRLFRVGLCYVLAIQAFLSAFDLTMAAASAPASDASLAICHNIDGDQPSSGDQKTPANLPCAICAAAAAALALVSGTAPAPSSYWVPAGLVVSPYATIVAHYPPSRDGCSRAPPSFA